MSEAALTGVLAEIAGVAGEEAALLVARARGGTRVRFSLTMRDDNWLVQAVGRGRAERIARHFTGNHSAIDLDLPLGPARGLLAMRRLRDEALAKGLSASEVALLTGYTQRGVFYAKAAARAREAEAADASDLFGPRD